ncbi:MAG: FAD-dependent oxidoreductase, partial [Hyphomicrobiaceae bacterium]
MKHVDLAVVGAGIMGLAHAIHAVRAGLSVAVFERNPAACGASVRNFGMLAIVAQTPGQQLEDARRALACWQSTALQAGINIEPSGCLFVAREPEEMGVLEEFADLADASGHTASLVTRGDL